MSIKSVSVDNIFITVYLRRTEQDHFKYQERINVKVEEFTKLNAGLLKGGAKGARTPIFLEGGLSPPIFMTS